VGCVCLVFCVGFGVGLRFVGFDELCGCMVVSVCVFVWVCLVLGVWFLIWWCYAVSFGI